MPSTHRAGHYTKEAGPLAPALQSSGRMIPTRSVGPTLCLLLCLLLLVPRVGFAAEEGVALTPEPSGVPGTSEPAPLRLNDENSWVQESERTPRGLRILAETGAGVLTGAGLGVAGLLAAGGLCGAGLLGGGDFGCLGEMGFGALLGIGLGLPLGVFWGGEVTGGDGKLYGALLGIAAGLAAGALVSVAMGIPYSVFYVSLPFILGGSIVGYELTTRPTQLPQPPMAPAVASSRPRLQPVLAFSSKGAVLGLGGSF